MNIQQLNVAVAHAKHWLPTQNPLQRFVHHNPLHAFEGKPFRDAVEHAATVFGARPWNLLSFYRDAYTRGRILDCDIDDVIKREQSDAEVKLPGIRLTTQECTRLLMLAPETGLHHPDSSAWWLNERRLIEELPVGLHRTSKERLLGCGEPHRVLSDLWQASSTHALHPPARRATRRLHRELPRGLFLDRRAFLVSYDPSQDTTGEWLMSLLAAAGPVGAGINLEYFFSFVDNERYGAGTKLPQNVVGNLAVMNGSSSDFRTGLVAQMVEIHEPVRLLVVVEGSPDALVSATVADPLLKQLVEHRWILIATFDADRGEAKFLEAGGFEVHTVEANELPVAASSESWYAGRRGCLAPAEIAGISPPSASEAVKL